MPACRAKGMSLLEVLIAAGLLLILFQVIVRVMVPGLAIMTRTGQRSGLQQQGAVALSRIERNFRRSSDFGVAIRGGEPLLMSVHCLQDSGQHFQGAARWENSLLLYAYRRADLRLTESRLAADSNLDTAHPHRCGPAELEALAQKPVTAVLGANVTEFRVERSPLAVYSLHLELAGSYRLSRSLSLRNP